jgi:hypothetical protein
VLERFLRKRLPLDLSAVALAKQDQTSAGASALNFDFRVLKQDSRFKIRDSRFLRNALVLR